ncbi:MAG: pyridoxal phosphate-dependent aminotransferase [Lachnospiraceae bacterium]|nr:pyridoxal phosphate-dependent aminotransferase [Lachnospiraceae bacterium]
MKYDFDKAVDRLGTFSMKLDCLPKNAPKDALSLWVADMDFPCAEPVIRALHERVDRLIFGYTIYDSEACKQAVIGWFKRRYDYEIAPEELFYSPGIVPAIGFLLNMLSEEDDGIVIQRPVYYPFTNKILGNGRKVVNNALIYEGGTYRMDYEDLEAKLADPANKGLILCSPHNPVGRVWKEEELNRVVDLCKKYGKWIISDEIHCDLTRAGVAHIPLLKLRPDYKDRIVQCSAPSKTFNLAGMQMSNVIIPNPEYRAAWRHETSDKFSIELPTTLGLTAMMAAYNEGEEWLEQVKAYIDGNFRFARDFIGREMPKAKVVEAEGTYLLWVDLNAYCPDAEDLENLMCGRAKVALDEGYIFGEEGVGFERLNLACTRATLTECLMRMKKALEG